MARATFPPHFLHGGDSCLRFVASCNLKNREETRCARSAFPRASRASWFAASDDEKKKTKTKQQTCAWNSCERVRLKDSKRWNDVENRKWYVRAHRATPAPRGSAIGGECAACWTKIKKKKREPKEKETKKKRKKTKRKKQDKKDFKKKKKKKQTNRGVFIFVYRCVRTLHFSSKLLVNSLHIAIIYKGSWKEKKVDFCP